MADAQSNLFINIDTTQALANIRALQAEISAFQTAMVKGNAKQQQIAQGLQRQLLNTVNATGQFSARMTTIASTTESFTNALEKNRLSMREYYRYGMASTKSFGRFFRSEFETINKVARERVKTLQTQYVKMGRDANGALRAVAVRPLALDMENLATKTALAAQRQQIFNQLLKQGSTNLLNFGKNTQWAGRQLMVGFTIPLSIMGTAAIREFKKIEEQAIRFRRVYGDAFSNTADTEQALENIRALASEFTKYGIAVEKTVGLAADVAQMGNVGQDLVAQVTEATRLAVLGGIEQQDALNTTISLTSAFGTAAEDLAKKIDFLNSVENQTVLSIEDFNEAIPKAGPVVEQLGGSIEDLAFFLTAMREGGINASESANALKSGLASIINPTDKAAEFVGKLGINLKAIVDANKGDVKGTVIGLAQALDTLDPLNRARAIEQLFGKFQFARISTLFQNVIKEGSQAQQVLKLTQATTAELAALSERELKRVEESPAFRLQKQIESLKAALAPVGEEFIKLITPLIDFATKILDQFNNLDSGVKTFITGTIAVLGGIAPVALMAFGLLANGVANIIKLFGTIRGVYQKAGSQSQILGQQTQYMTQEQLEAAAVAASLNQSHNVLIQTFTAEIAALNSLAAAYSRVAAAQAKSAAGFGPGIQTNIGKKPRKMKTGGILQVPGTGSGDKIPALLEPGEAVIPKRMTAKYSGFIQGMINDDIPGFRFGLNPFANMLGRSNVAARMQSKDFISSLRSGNTQYQSGFATKTGADYLTSMGLPNPAQAKLRERMEASMMGLGANSPISSRPTYGYARTSLLQRIFNSILFGKKGQRFNAATNPSDALNRYGDIDLVTKGSVAGRSSAFAGDMLLAFSRNQNLAKFSGPAPMRGATAAQTARAGMGAFNRPGGMAYPSGTGNSMAVNPKIPYLETQTPGGFAFSEISKVITKDPMLKAQLQAELRSAGLGSIRVTSPNFMTKLFKAMGVPGFEDGVILPSNTSKIASTTGIIAAHGSDFKRISDAQAKEFAKQNLTPGTRAYENFMKETGRGRNLYSNLVFGMPGMFNTGNMTGTDAARWISGNRNAFYSYLTNMYGLDPNAPSSRSFANSVSQRLNSFGAEKIDDRRFYDTISKSAKNIRNQEFRSIFSSAASSFATGEIFGSSGKSRREALAGAGPSYTRRRDTIRKLFNLPAKQFEAQLTGQKMPESGVVKSTTGSKKPAATKRIGGRQSDTRLTALTPGETVLNSKSTKAIRRGLFSFIPNLGVIGRADGIPEGQKVLPGQVMQTGNRYFQIDEQGRKVRISNAMGQQMMASQNASAMPRQSAMPRVMAGAGGVAGIASMGAMMYSMTGGPGAGMAGQAMMPLMAMSMILPLLGSKIGLVVAGLTAVVGGFVAVQMALNNTRKAAKDAALEMSSGKDAMLKFAEAAGTVTPDEYMDQVRSSRFAPFAVKPGESTFGQAFVESEAGVEMMESFKKQVAQFGRSDAIKALTRQLTTAVATGVLSAEQAKSIATSFGLKLNDFGITTNIAAAITEITGPDGKLLEGNTIKIYTEFIQGSTSGLTGPGGILQSEDLTGAQPMFFWDADKVAKAEGEAAALIQRTFDENQQIIDALDMQYTKQIDSLIASGKFDEALAKEEEYQQKRATLVEEYNKQIDAITTDFANVEKGKQDAILRGLVDSAKGVDIAVGTAADKLRTAEVQMRTSKTGAAGTAELKSFQEAQAQLGTTKVTILAQLAAGNLSADAFNNLMSTFDPTTGQGAIAWNALAKISTDVGPAALEQLNTIISVMDNPNQAAQIALKISQMDPEDAQNTIDTLSQLSSYDGKVVSAEVIVNYFSNNEAALDNLTSKFEKIDELKKQGKLNVEALIKNKIITEGQATEFEKYKFDEMSPGEQQTFTKVFISRFESIQPNEVAAFRAANPELKNIPDADIVEIIKRRISGEAAGATTEITGKGDTTAVTPDTNPDPGPGGTGTPKVTYKTIIQGLRDTQKETKQQNIAAKKLMDAGLDAADAYELVADKATAAAIASKKMSTKELAEVVRLQKEVTDELEQQNALANIRIAIEEFNKSKILEDSLAKTGLTKLEIAAILTDDDLMTRARGIIQKSKNLGGLSAESFGAEFNTRIGQILSEPEFFQAKWDEAYNAIEQTFEAQENALRINFEIDTKADRDLIQDAQRRIQLLQDKIDDYGFQLEEISIEEDKINEQYEKRAEALGRVSFISDRIARQQRAQLSIAEAISRGDIAAAAAAIQEARAQEAQDALDEQQRAMDLARERELGAIKSANGMTRKQIEDSILEVNRQIFDIRVKELEPAERRVELAQNDLDLAIQKLEIEGQSRLEWQNVNSQIVLAQQKTREWIELLKQAAFWAAEAMKGGKGGGSGGSGGPKSLSAAEKAKAAELERLIEITRGRVQSGQFTDEAQKQRLIDINIERIKDLRDLSGVANAGASGVDLFASGGMVPKYLAMGGMVPKYLRMGGMLPYKAEGGSIFKPLGTDTIPAMLSPGEFVIRKYAVDNFGVDRLKAINSGSYSGDSVYNYGITLNVSSSSNADEIAHKVITQIKRIDSQRLRSSTF